MVRVRQKSSYKQRAGKDEVWRSTLRTWTELTQQLTIRSEKRGRDQPTHKKMAGGIITTLMSDDWGREESAVNQNEKKENRGKKEREKESKKQRKKQRKRLHIGKRSVKYSEFSCLVNMEKNKVSTENLYSSVKVNKTWCFLLLNCGRSSTVNLFC